MKKCSTMLKNVHICVYISYQRKEYLFMSNLNIFLSKLDIGDFVKITQSNGQVLEGTVISNDNQEILSLQISMTSIVRYNSIDSVSIVNSPKETLQLTSANVNNNSIVRTITQSETKNQNDEKVSDLEIKEEKVKTKMNVSVDELPVIKPFPSKGELYNYDFSDDSFNKFFNELCEKDKNIIESTCSLLLNNYHEDNQESLKADSENLKVLSEKKIVSEYGKVSKVAACGLYLAENYDMSVKTFYNSDNLREAYLAAFNAAYRLNEDLEQYKFAAALSALYMISDNSDAHIEEAALCLRESSIKCKDISGVGFAIENCNDNLLIIAYCYEILRKICDKLRVNTSSVKTIGDIFSLVKEKYDSSAVFDTIIVMQKEKSEYEDYRKNLPEDVVVTVGGNSPKEFDTEGKITKLDFFEDKGVITGNSGELYNFIFDYIVDSTFRKSVKDMAGKSQKSSSGVSIPVKFEVDSTYKSPVAVKIQKLVNSPEKNKKGSKNGGSNTAGGSNTTNDPNNTSGSDTDPNKPIDDPKVLFQNQKYEEALAIYKNWLKEGKIEEGFFGSANCLLSLSNIDSNSGSKYEDELIALVEKYEDKLTYTIKVCSSLTQIYTKCNFWQKTIDVISRMEKYNIFNDVNQRIHFLVMKANSYRKIHEYENAIETNREVLRIIEKNKLYNQKQTVVNTAYSDLCDMYIELGDYQQAKYYYDISLQNGNNRPELKNKMDELGKKQKAIKLELFDDVSVESIQDINPNDDFGNQGLDSSNETTQQNTNVESDSYEFVEYVDEEAFERLITSDRDIITTALGFRKDQQECMITYLAAAAEICRLYANDKISDYSEMTAADTIISLSELINAAFAAYGFEKHLNADKLIYNYQSCNISVSEISESLFLSAALRAVFSDKTIQLFEIERLVSQVEKTDSKYKSAVLLLLDLFKSFYIQTGRCMDTFADYNTNSNSLKLVIESAKKCQQYLEQRMKTYESQGQVRRARELIFCDDSSVISYGLKAVCDNDISKASKVKKELISLFMRNDDELSVGNIDVKKLDEFIDSNWEMARDIILSEKRNVNRPHDNLKGGKRNNITNIIRRIIDCICRWLVISENVELTKDPYSLGQYSARKNDVISYLCTIEEQLANCLDEKFDWGVYSLKCTVNELLDKIEGKYNPLVKKYISYEGFLKTNHILLDENFVPEIDSTFSDLPGFDIFSRIKAYASCKKPEFKYRISQIFSDNIHNSNFRCAKLIKEYGEFFRIEDITGEPLFEDLDECIKSSKRRTTYFYKDFKNELELDESYGSISDVKGYKTFVGNNIDSWYGRAMSSCDFGLFSDVIDAYRKSISENAETKAKKLAEQLSDLACDPQYDFGIYTVQQIRDHIEERNFAIAENILNCIRRNDTKNIADFTKEPKGIFDNFMAEYDSLYRAVSDTSVHLQKSLMTYYGKKNIEVVLKRVTNNMNKDVRGGIALINSWPVVYPAGVGNISKFISLLGFTNATVTKDSNFNKEDVYSVSRKPQTGKVTYPHPIPAFGSLSEDEGIRVIVLYGRYDTDRLIDKFHEIDTVSKNTIVILDSVLNQVERRRFARKIKEEKSFSRSFIIIDRVLLFYLAKHYQSNTISRMLMATTMPFSYNQPFYPKPNAPLPGELFTGRKEELRLIESYDGVNLVYGGRQLGKSSLLKMAKHNIDKNSKGDRAIVIDIKGRNYTEAAKKVSQELIINDILPECCECDDWDTLTMHIKKRLKDDSETRISYLLIMLDEADKFIESCREIEYRPITTLKNMLSTRFKFVLAGLHNLSKYDYEAVYSNNYDISHLESLVVRPFKRPEATELLTHALGYLGFLFSDDVINLILAKTNYFPGLIHLYGQKLLEAMSDDYAGYSETDTPYYYVTENHIKKVLADSGFKDEIKNKLRMTLEVSGKENSPYYVIALLMAYMCYEEIESGYRTEFSVDDIIEKAKSNEINILANYTREQIIELLHEMWDLNIVSCKGEYYMFSTEGFRELLGTQEEVNTELAKYVGR